MNAAAPKTAIDRCLAYVEKMPAAISGSGGHDAAFAVACECCRFGLEVSDAAEVMSWYNTNRCEPLWTEPELGHKLKDAYAKVEAAGELGCRLLKGRNTAHGRTRKPKTCRVTSSRFIAPVIASITS
jgi:hypothetical protein